MNYQEALAYLDGISAFGSSYGLKTTAELMRRLGNIQDNMRFVHIAGTNGKGSVVSYTANVLEYCGYTVGTFTSPALVSFRERIQVNGEYISKEDTAHHLSRLKIIAEEMQKDGFQHPTYFELSLALALLYYAQKKCQIVILEVGLGGRLDATNIVNPLICGIVSISLDHTQLLGDTLAAIAQEKGGIIKENVPLICAPQAAEAAAVLQNICLEKHAPFTMIRRENIQLHEASRRGQIFSCKSRDNYFPQLKINLLGAHQLDNAAVALEILLNLRSFGFVIGHYDIYRGFANTRWAGRFELIGEKPDFIIDGAHNPDAALRLKKALEEYYPHVRKIFVLSILADKDYEEILRLCAPLAEVILATTTDNPRALSTEDLTASVKKYNKNVIPCADLAQAVAKAQELARKEDLIVAFGSLTHLGEVRHLLTHLPKED